MTLVINPDAIPALPANARVTYLNEGAANIVYRLSVPCPSPQPSDLEDFGDGTPPPSTIEVYDNEGQGQSVDTSVFDDKLLRLRKDLPTAPTCIVSQTAYLRLITPLFDKNQLVKQSLVKVAPMKLIQRLNSELRKFENKPSVQGPQRDAALRQAKRRGTYLAEDEYGLLVTEMLSVDGCSIIEFKPKWLAQSPSAPPNSVRCRQCAYIARVNAQQSRNGECLEKLWCPLGLVSGDWDVVLNTAEMLLRARVNRPSPRLEESEPFARWIHNTVLLRRLRDNQVALDPCGPLNAKPSDEKFRLAMTLRDVTVYLRYPDASRNDPSTWEARIGDLDIKSADKAERWKAKEKELISEGWYTGKEKIEDRQPVTCYLDSGDL